MPRKKNSLTNRLLRQLPNSKRLKEPIKNIKEFINYKLSALEYTASLVEMEIDLLLKDLYLEKS